MRKIESRTRVELTWTDIKTTRSYAPLQSFFSSFHFPQVHSSPPNPHKTPLSSDPLNLTPRGSSFYALNPRRIILVRTQVRPKTHYTIGYLLHHPQEGSPAKAELQKKFKDHLWHMTRTGVVPLSSEGCSKPKKYDLGLQAQTVDNKRTYILYISPRLLVYPALPFEYGKHLCTATPWFHIITWCFPFIVARATLAYTVLHSLPTYREPAKARHLVFPSNMMRTGDDDGRSPISCSI